MSSGQFFLHISFGVILTTIGYTITRLMLHNIRVIDHPNERSLHAEAIPKSGGISIAVTYLIGMIAIYLFGNEHYIKQQYIAAFVFSSLLIAVISLYDDIKNKSFKFKLLSQLIAVFVVLFSGIVIDELALPGLGYTTLGWISYPLSFLWIVGLTNAYNFMDGIDGLMGGVAVIVSLFFMAISYYHGSEFVYITCYTILAGALGFLFFNFPPAKIFMGDVGSAFLGFTFATLAIIAARYDNSHTSFLVMPLLLFNVIYDTVFTFLRRLSNGEDVTNPHRSHLYQIMVRLGYSHMEVTLIHYCMCFLQGLGALWMVRIPGDQRLFIFIPFLLLQVFYTFWVMKAAKRRQLVL